MKDRIARLLSIFALIAAIISLVTAILVYRTTSADASQTPTRRGYATYYTKESSIREGTSGTHTANGERFREGAQTCALRRRDFGKTYKVTNVANGKWVYVRHNDYGPGEKATRNGVIVDLTPKAFRSIAEPDQHKIKVKVQEVRK